MPLNFDEDALREMVENSEGFKQMQEDANRHIRQVIREVNQTHRGQSVAVVDAELRRRFADDEITPTEENFAQIVREISAGTLTDNGR